jgi:N-acyl-L-homoserine lactone synthetase
MMQLISPNDYGNFVNDLAEMHRLRYRVFKQRLDWSVRTCGDMEADEFDVLRPVHLLNRSTDGRIQGCVRLLPSIGPTMLRDVFSVLLHGQPAPRGAQIWESSRFALDVAKDATKARGGLARATYELFAGMIEFGLSNYLTEIVTVTDIRMERILRRAGWPLRPIGAPQLLGNTMALAGYLEVSNGALDRVRRCGDISGPVLWAPVMRAAA